MSNPQLGTEHRHRVQASLQRSRTPAITRPAPTGRALLMMSPNRDLPEHEPQAATTAASQSSRRSSTSRASATCSAGSPSCHGSAACGNIVAAMIQGLVVSSPTSSTSPALAGWPPSGTRAWSCTSFCSSPTAPSCRLLPRIPAPARSCLTSATRADGR